MSAKPVRLALIGLGSMGLGHLRIFADLAPWAQIAALADSHAPFVERAAALVPSAQTFHDPLACVRSAEIDGVVVATADATHHRIVEACITRGVPVLCEKPLTLSAETSLQLVKAEQAVGRRLVQVAYMRRHDAEYRYLHATLRSRRIGDPVLITQRHHNPLSVNTFNAQQLITSSAAHDIDLFRWLTAEEVCTVASATKASDDGATVAVLVTLTSQSGVLGLLEVGRGPGMQYDIGLNLVASAGALTLGSPTLATRALTDGGAALHLPDTWIERFNSAYRAQDAAWLTAVANDSIDGASAYDGYATNAVIDAALAALSSGKTEPVNQVPA